MALIFIVVKGVGFQGNRKSQGLHNFTSSA